MTFDFPPWAMVLLATLLLGQASWIFYDAGRRGEPRLLWGLFGLANCPSSLIIYLLVTRRKGKTKICPQCGNNLGVAARFCPNCGVSQSPGPGAGK